MVSKLEFHNYVLTVTQPFHCETTVREYLCVCVCVCGCVCVCVFLFSVVQRVGKCDDLFLCTNQSSEMSESKHADSHRAVCLCFQMTAWWSQLVDYFILINIWCYKEIFKISHQTFRVNKLYIYRNIQLFHWTSWDMWGFSIHFSVSYKHWD